ncbi:exo-rhamnogalacturonan lyase family protein [Zhihengliuella flava]|uniref:Tat pathway signal sequence domain protein n=1 Tax=Zhihengliuella flava TaxID=1285193 RepID=A0A931D951_9MICC|nr:Tat pathway signal sequence domain protein [Zhihengliuella flava]MBG6084298.1 hypothetical protein [Zhihengliuella flava]
MKHVSRRHLLQGAAASGAGGLISSSLFAATAAAAPAAPQATAATGHGPVNLTWLEENVPARLAAGATFGVPWPRGALDADSDFALTTADGSSVPVQNWTTGWWPDGSIKWTAHAVGDGRDHAEAYTLAPGTPTQPETALSVKQQGSQTIVDTGVIRVTFASKGPHLIKKIERGSTVIAEHGTLVAQRKDQPASDAAEKVTTEAFTARIDEVTVEQEGPVRAVVRITGRHEHGNRRWLPFDVRFYLYAGSDGLRLVHSFVFDGDAGTDFISGLGVQFSVPMRGEQYDRHIRFAGADRGVLAEAVRGITGLRRDPGEEVRAAQIAGQALPDPSTWDQRVTERLHWIPTWGEYSLTQLTAHGFEIHKRTKPGHSWIRVDADRRAGGLGYVGTPSGGLAFGLRNFWQLHPTELAVAGAETDAATATVWMYSPKADPMDLRFYHDGLGQDTYEEQLDALNITYEDYEPEFGTPYGVARTSELMFWALDATPSNDEFADLAEANATPPLLQSTPEHMSSTGIFGSWAPVDRSTQARAAIEDNLDAMHAYYVGQTEQRSWYGFWDYGDVMHTYDGDRHQWRYDVGGYAWDNSELSTDMWLWYHYLRTGDATAFRYAEAMTRHTGEVDVYHLGDWAGLGTRHGVLHWADSAKQLRISNAGYRRFYYFLTADERVGDLMHSLIDADETFLKLDPYRKIREDEYNPDPSALAVSNTTDWGSIALAWLAEWERNGDEIAKTKLLNGARTIAAMPNGWSQGGTLKYNMADGKFAEETEQTVEVGSLDSVFGLIELMTELVELLDEDDVREQWTTYCRLYNGTSDEQREATGHSWGSQNLRQSYSRASAYASVQLSDPDLAARAWKEFRTGHAGYPEGHDFSTRRIEGSAVLKPVDEADLSTNASAQYGLAAIQNLALIGDHLEESN